MVSIPNGAVVPPATTISVPRPGNQGIVKLLHCFRSVAALERCGNLAVMTIRGTARWWFATHRCDLPWDQEIMESSGP